MVNERQKRFNQAHLSTSEFDTSDSLFKLLSKALERNSQVTTVAEFGCGQGTHLSLVDKDIKKKCFDISSVAIERALESSKSDTIDFITHDLLFQLNESFDLILDSHLFHCLTSMEDIDKYLVNCFHMLNPGGSFVLETMVSNKKYLDYFSSEIENSVLYYNYEPIRTILHERELEELILSKGFEIDQLFLPFGKKFILQNYCAAADEYHPDCIQIICKKPLD